MINDVRMFEVVGRFRVPEVGEIVTTRIGNRGKPEVGEVLHLYPKGQIEKSQRATVKGVESQGGDFISLLVDWGL